LDGLRFLAFLAVFVYHLSAFRWAGLDAVPLIGWLGNHGWMGVDLFFALSAFLLTTLLRAEHLRTGGVDLRKFMVRRSLRIWPLYFLVVGLSFAELTYAAMRAGSLAGIGESLTKYLIPFAGFFGNMAIASVGYPDSSLLGNLWTISVEEQFYVLLPLALVWVRMAPRGIVGLAATFIVVALLTRTHLVINGASPLAAYMLTPARLDAFAVGILVAICFEQGRHSGRLTLFCAMVIAPLCLIAAGEIGDKDALGTHLIPLYLLGAGGTGALLLLVLHDGPHSWILGSSVLRHLGRLSYGLYVYHWIGIKLGVVVARSAGLSGGTAVLIGGLISFVGTYLLAIASYHLVERRFLLLKQRFEVVASRAA
jgi:peptidoglycan/LPS O-acetylase OafA/YrhL